MRNILTNRSTASRRLGSNQEARPVPRFHILAAMSSLTSRASRLLAEGSGAQSSCGPQRTSQKKGTGLTPEQIKAIWRRFVIKLSWILRHLQHSESTLAVLSYKTTDKDGGQAIFNLHFGHLTSSDDKKNNPAAPDHWNPNEPGRMRVIDQFIVGARLKDSENSKGSNYSVKLGNCVHPETRMKKRANGKVTWFTCMDCGARWNRLPCVPENQHLHAPLDKEVLSFGKFAR